MTPQKQLHVALAAFACVFGLFAVLAAEIHGGWVIGAMLSVVALGLWATAFGCPKCGTPYLWTMSDAFLMSPLPFPAKCRKCGYPTSEQA